MNKTYTGTVTTDPMDPEEHLLNFSEEFFQDQDWKIGDKIEWKLDKDGVSMLNISKQKREQQPIFLVETLSIFRITYAVRAKSAEHAMDTVTMEEAEEMSQVHLDEIINSTRRVTEEEYLKVFNEQNNYLKGWDIDQKLKYITSVNYSKENKKDK
jgi:hypothetical protein